MSRFLSLLISIAAVARLAAGSAALPATARAARAGRGQALAIAALLFAAIFAAPREAQAQLDQRCVDRLASGQNRYHAKIAVQALRKLSVGLATQPNITQNRYALLIDYSKSSREKRSFLLDLVACDVVSSEYVIHGGTVYHPVQQNFGDINNDGVLDRCEHANGSHKYMTRPGLFVTAGCHKTALNGWTDVYQGCNGVKLVGLEPQNREAMRAGVVLHEHVQIPDNNSVKPAGQGCPAFPPGKLRAMMRYGMFSGALVLVHAPQCDERVAAHYGNLPFVQRRYTPANGSARWVP